MDDPLSSARKWREVFALEGDRDLLEPTIRGILEDRGVPMGTWCRVSYNVESTGGENANTLADDLETAARLAEYYHTAMGACLTEANCDELEAIARVRRMVDQLRAHGSSRA